MSKALGGLLQIAGSAGAGGFAAVQKNNTDKLESLRAEALKTREEFLLGLKYTQEKTLAEAKQTAVSNENLLDRTSKEKINSDRITADNQHNQDNIDSRELISKNSIDAESTRANMSRQTALEVAQIRASRSSGGGGGKSDDLAKNQLKVLEFTGKGLEDSSLSVEQVNEARALVNLPPLEKVSTGTSKADDGFLGFGATKTENYELVPEGAGKKLSTVANEKGKLEAKNTKSLAELVSSVNEKKADQPQSEEIEEKQPGLLSDTPAEVEESPVDPGNLFVDEDGTIWKKDGDKTVRYMTKPSERINTGVVESMGGNTTNPDYVEYQRLLHQISVKK